MEIEQISGEQEYVFRVEPGVVALLQIETKEPLEELEITIETDTDKPVIVEETIMQRTKIDSLDLMDNRPVDRLAERYREYRETEKKVMKDIAERLSSQTAGKEANKLVDSIEGQVMMESKFTNTTEKMDSDISINSRSESEVSHRTLFEPEAVIMEEVPIGIIPKL